MNDKTTSALAGRQLLILLAISASMAMPLPDGTTNTRWDDGQRRALELFEELDKLGQQATLVLFGGDQVKLMHPVDGERAREAFANTKLAPSDPAEDRTETTPFVQSPLGAALAMAEPLRGENDLVVVLTDSVPGDSGQVSDLIHKSANGQFIFVQIGDDPEASDYLQLVADVSTYVDVTTHDLIGAFESTVDIVAAAATDHT